MQKPSGEIRLVVSSLKPSRQETVEKKTAERSDLTITSKCKKALRRQPGESPGFGGLPRTTRFSKKSAMMVRERSAAIEKAYTKDKCRFLTATIPGSAEFTSELTARYSGWITQHLNQWLRDTAPGLNYVYVWELQKRGVLHVHYLVAHFNDQKLQQLESNFKSYWCELLTKLSALTGKDIFERADGGSWQDAPQVVQVLVQPVIKSVVNYLAKYLSKSARDVISGAQFCASRWWGSSKESEKLRLQFSKVVHGASDQLSRLNSAIEGVLGSLSDAVGAVFTFTDRWRPFRETRLVYTSPQSSPGDLFEKLCAKLSLGTSHVQPMPPPEGGISAEAVLWEFWGTGARLITA